MSQQHRNIITVKISGEVTDRQMADISKAIEKEIAGERKTRLFVAVEHYPSFDSAESLYEDLRFAKIYADHIEKMAVVGDRQWKETFIALFGLFSGIESAYFDRSEFESAWEWVRS